MTAGEDALHEAARLEAARVYGGVVREHHNTPRATWAAVAEAELAARAPVLPLHVPKAVRTAVEQAIARGWPEERICAELDVEAATVRRVLRDMEAA